MNKFYYTLFGLTVCSEQAFAELIEIDPIQSADVNIIFTSVNAPQGIDDQSRKMIQRVRKNYYYIQVGEFARILAEHQESTTVYIDVHDEEKMSIIKSWLFGSVFTAVLQMNNRFALHASAVKTSDGVVLFCGVSGIGKSTIATRLNNKGFDIVTDDKAVLSLGEDDKLYIEPSIQITRLWEDSLDKLEDDSFMENPESVELKDKKFQYLIKQENRILKPLQVKSIYIIRRVVETGKLRINPLQGLSLIHI